VREASLTEMFDRAHLAIVFWAACAAVWIGHMMRAVRALQYRSAPPLRALGINGGRVFPIMAYRRRLRLMAPPPSTETESEQLRRERDDQATGPDWTTRLNARLGCQNLGAPT